MTTNTSTVCDCGHVATSNGTTTGYGTAPDGKKYCFACCGERDKADMLAQGKAVLYLTEKEGHYQVTNWPGTLKIEPYRARLGRHNIAGSRCDVWFNLNGQSWHGVQYGEWTQICHCKRLKSA